MFTKISFRYLQRVLRLAAALLAIALPLGLLIGGAQPVAVGLVPPPWDKLVHAAVFAVLAGAIGYASGLRGRRASALAFFGALTVGVLDELHQMRLPGRSAGWDDLAADAFGAALGAVALLWRERLENRLFKNPFGQ
ncbi:MAG: VanZ family protein [Rhodoferax sp.]|uniref:VanZ family protein n=1 Tax=Rhodoferax sp. TaxID=50421 RepID=UPI002724F512|nr:VanZ family protein [Rhodoferax sp.]MDO8450791.1 VanZ family protein [Rhodoferax sp.]